MSKIEISHSGFELTKDIKKYIEKRLSKFDKLLSREKRRQAHIEVKLKEEKGKKKNKCTAEIILKLPRETITAKESTVNIFAAIDIVEAKVSNQLRKYKDKKVNHRADRRGVLKKFRDMADRDFRGRQN